MKPESVLVLENIGRLLQGPDLPECKWRWFLKGRHAEITEIVKNFTDVVLKPKLPESQEVIVEIPSPSTAMSVRDFLDLAESFRENHPGLEWYVQDKVLHAGREVITKTWEDY
jgi:hypothetical protein